MSFLPQNHPDDLGEAEIHEPQNERHDHRDDNHNGTGRNGLLGRGPRHLFQLGPGFLQELPDFKPDLFYLVQRFALYGRKWQARRDSNPQHPDLESGALAIRATGLCPFSLLPLFCFLVRRVGLAELAELLHLEAVLHGSLVLRRRVVAVLAFRASQRNVISHFCSTLTEMEPTTRIELVTSSLPRMCSTD